MKNGTGTSKQVFVLSLQDLLQEKEEGLEGFLDQIDSCCPWFQKQRTLDKRTWEKLEKRHDPLRQIILPLCLWIFIKDATDEENKQASDSTLGELEESQEGRLPERTFSEKGPLNPKLERYRDTTDELT